MYMSHMYIMYIYIYLHIHMFPYVSPCTSLSVIRHPPFFGCVDKVQVVDKKARTRHYEVASQFPSYFHVSFGAKSLENFANNCCKSSSRGKKPSRMAEEVCRLSR